MKAMILPTQNECASIIAELEDEPNLNDWESNFVESNLDRTWFTDSQRAVIADLAEKYDV